MAENRLLVHISDRDKWSSALGLVTRILGDRDENDLKIVIIADIFAGAVCIACSKSLKQQMIDFVKAGQSIVVCEESLRYLNISLKSLPDFVRTVPVALWEIVRLKSEGFTYIKL